MTEQAVTPPKKWYSPEETATRTGLSLSTVYNWIRSKKIPTSQPGGRKGKHFISEETITALLSPKEPTP